MGAVITRTVENTTLTINGHIFNDFLSGDFLELTPVNPHSSHINGTDGSVTMFRRSDGDVETLTIRLQRYSDDDVYMNSIVNTGDITLLNGSLKSVFSRNSVELIDTVSLNSGSITGIPTKIENDQDGNAGSEYIMTFRNVIRNL